MVPHEVLEEAVVPGMASDHTAPRRLEPPRLDEQSSFEVSRMAGRKQWKRLVGAAEVCSWKPSSGQMVPRGSTWADFGTRMSSQLTEAPDKDPMPR